MLTWLIGRGRVPSAIALALVTAFFAMHAARLEVEQSNESMNALSDARLGAYGEFKRKFGNDEDVVVAVTVDGGLDAATVRLVESLEAEIEALDGVRQVSSLASARQVVTGPGGAEDAALLQRPLAGDDFGQSLSAALDRNPHLTGLLVAADRRTTALVIELEDRPHDDRYRPAIIAALRALAARESHGPIQIRITGIAVQKHDVARYVQRDQSVLVPAAVVVLAAVLALSFRRPAGVVLPLLVTAVSLLWTLGCYSLAGFALNTITSLLAPVVMVLSVATSVHLYHGWLEDDGGADPASRIRDTVARLYVPCGFTALTTALGLLSLATSDTPAVRQFGAFAALGVMFSLLAGLVVVPLGLSFLKAPSRPSGGERSPALSRLLAGTARVASRRHRSILAGAVLVTVVSAMSLPSIPIDTDLVRFLRPGAPLYRDTMFIDANLGAVGSLELVVSRVDGKPLTGLSDIERIERFSDRVLDERGVADVHAVDDMVAQVHRAETGGDVPTLPTSQDDLYYAFDLIADAGTDDLLRRLAVPDFTEARLSVRVRSMGSADTSRLVDSIVAVAHEVFGERYRLVTTGSLYHVALDSDRIVINQLRSFALALVTVIVAIGVLFRSWRVAVLSIAPNVFPIVWTGGLMALAGIALSTGTAMIASVVIGLAVDDTIHYLARYRREMRGNCPEALTRTSCGVGAALTITTAVLVLGFWVGCLGSFLPTVYFSLLAGTTMVAALACDLLVLPAALVMADRRSRGGGW